MERIFRYHGRHYRLPLRLVPTRDEHLGLAVLIVVLFLFFVFFSLMMLTKMISTKLTKQRISTIVCLLLSLILLRKDLLFFKNYLFCILFQTTLGFLGRFFKPAVKISHWKNPIFWKKPDQKTYRSIIFWKDTAKSSDTKKYK